MKAMHELEFAAKTSCGITVLLPWRWACSAALCDALVDETPQIGASGVWHTMM
tara:strand:- start:21040 stop:21198 length:159 start_codon:yes stop_codon:yes gene_type:complete